MKIEEIDAAHHIQTFYARAEQRRTKQAKYYNSLSYKRSGAWMHASTKLDGNLLSDQEAIDDLARRCGLELDLPSTCQVCRRAITSVPSPEEHGIACTSKRGGNGTAGGLVERAIISGLAKLNVQMQKKPRLDIIPFMETVDGSENAKQIGDAKITDSGQEFIVDITFSSKPHETSVEQKETIKFEEYKANRRFPDVVKNKLKPFAVDAGGRWGPIMEKFFDGVVERKKHASPEMKKEIAGTYRYMIEEVSLAVVRANGAYMHIMRRGVPVKERSPRGGNKESDAEEGNDENQASESNTSISNV